MLNIIKNDLDGKYAVPEDHPITCANPAPWKIIEMKIRHDYDLDCNDMVWKIWVRGEGSMWFRADQCFISSEDECDSYMEMRGIK